MIFPIAHLLKFLALLLAALLLTVLTQVGGLVLVAAILSWRWIDQLKWARWQIWLSKGAYFIALYMTISFLIVPPIARQFGRVPLPIMANNTLLPMRQFTWLMNRHYVQEELLVATQNVADELGTSHPGNVLYYLDANFPFGDGFPLLPHRSHDDGKKLDLAFAYRHPDGHFSHGSPSWLGYGAYETPLKGEVDQPAACAAAGHWQYSFMDAAVPDWSLGEQTFDADRTRAIVNGFANQPGIAKIFIEPHLRVRLQLNSPKVRYHGCNAARHDDHIHVQLQ